MKLVFFYFHKMILRIKVKPNSKVDEVLKEADGSIKIKIKAPPVEGKANKYLIAYLASFFEIPKSKIQLQKGETNSYKTLEIDAEETYITERLTKV